MRTFFRFTAFIIGALLLTPIGILIFNPSAGSFNNFLYWMFTLSMSVVLGWNFYKIFPAEKKTDD